MKNWGGGGSRTPTSVRLGAVRVHAGAQAVGAHPLPLAGGLQLGELPLQVPPLSFQNLHLVLTPPVRLLQFLGGGGINGFPLNKDMSVGVLASQVVGQTAARGWLGGIVIAADIKLLLKWAIIMSINVPLFSFCEDCSLVAALDWGRSSKSWLSWSALMQPSPLYPGLEAAIRTEGHGATDWAIDLLPGRRAAALPPEPQLAQLLFTQLIKLTQKRCQMELKQRRHLRNVHRRRVGIGLSTIESEVKIFKAFLLLLEI